MELELVHHLALVSALASAAVKIWRQPAAIATSGNSEHEEARMLISAGLWDGCLGLSSRSAEVLTAVVHPVEVKCGAIAGARRRIRQRA